jgi:hypothetical protein
MPETSVRSDGCDSFETAAAVFALATGIVPQVGIHPMYELRYGPNPHLSSPGNPRVNRIGRSCEWISVGDQA